jgi:hypothetical protein
VKQRRELYDLNFFDSHLSAAIRSSDSRGLFITRAKFADIGSWLASVSVGSFAA